MTLRLGDSIIGRLQPGDEVMVVEIVGVSEDNRIRGRLESPSGWISLLNTENDYRWAERLGAIASVISLPAEPRRFGKPNPEAPSRSLDVTGLQGAPVPSLELPASGPGRPP